MKNIIAVMMTLILTALLLTACQFGGGSSETTAAEPTAAEAADNADTAESTEAAAAISEVADSLVTLPAYTVAIDSVETEGFISEVKDPQVSYTGFSYENEGDDAWIIEMNGTVLTGSFTYNKDFTDAEFESFLHGGSLYLDEDTVYEGDDIQFFSDYKSLQYAIKLPDEIQSGSYTATIDQIIGNENAVIIIRFTVTDTILIDSFDSAMDFDAWNNLNTMVQFANAVVTFEDNAYYLSFRSTDGSNFIYLIDAANGFDPAQYNDKTVSGTAQIVETTYAKNPNSSNVAFRISSVTEQ